MPSTFIGPLLRSGRRRQNVKRRLAPATSSAVTRIVKRQIKNTSERKIFDISTGVTPVTVAGLILNMTSTMTKGDDYNNREGDQVRASGFDIKMYHAPHATQTLLQIIRVIFFMDNGSTGSGTPTISDLLQLANPHSMINSNATEVKRFRILSDRMLSVGISQGDPNNSHCYSKKIKLDKFISWTHAGSGNKGQIYCAVVADNVLGGQSTVNVFARLYYTE